MLNNGAPINAGLEREGGSVLHHSVKAGNVEVVEALLDNKVFSIPYPWLFCDNTKTILETVGNMKEFKRWRPCQKPFAKLLFTLLLRRTRWRLPSYCSSTTPAASTHSRDAPSAAQRCIWLPTLAIKRLVGSSWLPGQTSP